jgi:DNA polymerase III delta subunit
MDILSFLKNSEGKNIFIFEGNNKIAINSYKNELIQYLKAKYNLEVKYYDTNAQTGIIVEELNTTSCFGRTLVVSTNSKISVEKIKNTKNFLILELDQKNQIKLPKLQNIQHILLQKKQDIFSDLIKYYAKQHSILIEDNAIKIIINYFFTNDFSIENEIIKLKLYFHDKKILTYKDLSIFFQDYSYSINKLCQSLIYSDLQSFLKEINNFIEDEYILLIRSLLRYFNIMLEYLLKLEKGIPKELAIQDTKKLNFYDDRALNYIVSEKFNSINMRHILICLMDLEKKYKTLIIQKKYTIMYGLISVFIIIKNSKRKP